MKKLIVALLVFLFYTGGQSAKAQKSDNAYLLTWPVIRSDNAAVKAARDLWVKVGDQKKEEWYKLSQGYLATFREGTVESRYMYDVKGNWLYTLLTYAEKDLPVDLRRGIRSTYYDYSISWAKEVRQGEDVVYIVHIENEKEWKNLSVLPEGEMREMLSVCKQ